jgi:peptide/nickel transport system permease protein
VAGAVLSSLMVGMTIVSFLWTPDDPVAVDVAHRLQPPSAKHWFGTDELGRDLLSRVMTGGQNSLYVTLSATLLGVIFGTALGLAAAGSGSRVGNLLTRVSDIGIAMPSVLIALVLATTVGPGPLSIVIAITVWFVPVTARVVIGPARQILSLEFIEASMTHGRGRLYILCRHVLPNISPLIIVQISVMIPAGILIEAALSFLGVGAQPPTSSWGSIMAQAQPRLEVAPYLTLLPGAVIVITVLGFNLLGDGLRVALDPQQSTRGVL